MSTRGEPPGRSRGRRAEKVALWYLRLNGVFAIPGFLVHWDHLTNYPRTELTHLVSASRQATSGQVLSFFAMTRGSLTSMAIGFSS